MHLLGYFGISNQKGNFRRLSSPLLSMNESLITPQKKRSGKAAGDIFNPVFLPLKKQGWPNPKHSRPNKPKHSNPQTHKPLGRSEIVCRTPFFSPLETPQGRGGQKPSGCGWVMSPNGDHPTKKQKNTMRSLRNPKKTLEKYHMNYHRRTLDLGLRSEPSMLPLLQRFTESHRISTKCQGKICTYTTYCTCMCA